MLVTEKSSGFCSGSELHKKIVGQKFSGWLRHRIPTAPSSCILAACDPVTNTSLGSRRALPRDRSKARITLQRSI